MPGDKSPVVCETDLDAPIEKVWSVFTTDEGLKFLGVSKAKIDLKIGGKMLTHYDPNGVLGDEGTIENTVIAYEPLHVFAFRITKPPKNFPFVNAFKDTWSIATMTDLGGGRTHLRLAMMGYTFDEESQKMRRFFAQGNPWVLEKLRLNLSGDAPKPGTPAPATAALEDPLAPVVCEAIIGAPAAEVWKTLTTAEGMKGIVPDAKIELRVGGPYELYFSKDAPAGQRGSEGCTVLSYEPGSMLSFNWNAPPKFGALREKHTWVVVHVEPHGPHASRVVLKEFGFAEQAAAGDAAQWKELRAYFAHAWPSVLEAIKEKFEPPAK